MVRWLGRGEQQSCEGLPYSLCALKQQGWNCRGGEGGEAGMGQAISSCMGHTYIQSQ